MEIIPQRDHAGKLTGLFFAGKFGPMSLRKARKIVNLLRLLDEIEAPQAQAPGDHRRQPAATAPITPDILRGMLLVAATINAGEHIFARLQKVIFDMAAENGVENHHKREDKNHGKQANTPRKHSFRT